ncbi:hypothetical protein CR513_63043, partial [Mucuna pruriens]
MLLEVLMPSFFQVRGATTKPRKKSTNCGVVRVVSQSLNALCDIHGDLFCTFCNMSRMYHVVDYYMKTKGFVGQILDSLGELYFMGFCLK